MVKEFRADGAYLNAQECAFFQPIFQPQVRRKWQILRTQLFVSIKYLHTQFGASSTTPKAVKADNQRYAIPLINYGYCLIHESDFLEET